MAEPVKARGSSDCGYWIGDRRLSEWWVPLLGFGSARYLNRNAGQTLGRTAALPVDDQGGSVRFCGRSLYS
jgi:hypothetical protein